MAERDRYTAQNRRAWNEIAHVRKQELRRRGVPAEFFAAGGSSLDARVVDAVGDVRGRPLLHLMCATGEETLSWAVAGAEAVGVDISDVEIDLAIEKASAAGIAALFVTADVGSRPPDLARGDVDVVYTIVEDYFDTAGRPSTRAAGRTSRAARTPSRSSTSSTGRSVR